MDNNSRIIFLTSQKKYVFSAFDVSATRYLLKPLDTKKLEKVLTKITKELTSEREYCCGIPITYYTMIPFVSCFFGRTSAEFLIALQILEYANSLLAVVIMEHVGQEPSRLLLGRWLVT